MDKLTDFIEQLRVVAKVIEPYIKNDREINPKSKFVPYASTWSSSIMTISYLLEYQESSLTEKQLKYLDRQLFGGLGSLQDLTFSKKELGIEADDINVRLRKAIEELYKRFERIKRG